MDHENAADTPSTTDPPDEPTPEARLSDAERRAVQHLRRALLAENTGQVVPELVAGDTEEALAASVEVARSAFAAARDAALAAMRPPAAPPVPPSTPARDTAESVPLSPLQKIAFGLKRD